MATLPRATEFFIVLHPFVQLRVSDYRQRHLNSKVAHLASQFFALLIRCSRELCRLLKVEAYADPRSIEELNAATL